MKNGNIDASKIRVVAVMAAYNEAKNIEFVINGIIEQGYGCIVVDDGSVDNTSEIARAAGAKVLRHHTNLGQGYGLLTGFKAAMMESVDLIIEIDADGQHDPKEIPIFVQEIIERNSDIVVGSRILGSNHDDAHILRRIFLPYFTAIINIITGYNMTDAMCGFRAFRAPSLRKVSHLLNNMLEPQYLAAELFIRFSRAGLTVSEVPVNLHNRASGSSYKGIFRYGYGVIKTIFRAHTR